MIAKSKSLQHLTRKICERKSAKRASMARLRSSLARGNAAQKDMLEAIHWADDRAGGDQITIQTSCTLDPANSLRIGGVFVWCPLSVTKYQSIPVGETIYLSSVF